MGCGGVESAPKGPVSFPRKEVVSNLKLWVLEGGGKSWASKRPHTMGRELLGSGTVLGTHPVGFRPRGHPSSSSPILPSANTPVLLGCPCVPSASLSSLAGLLPFLISP